MCSGINILTASVFDFKRERKDHVRAGSFHTGEDFQDVVELME